MSPWALSIRRPVFATVVSLALILFGAIGYSRLSVRELPDIEFPTVTIQTVLPGASPEVVEKEVNAWSGLWNETADYEINIDDWKEANVDAPPIGLADVLMATLSFKIAVTSTNRRAEICEIWEHEGAPPKVSHAIL